jgi:hypothetical protein
MPQLFHTDFCMSGQCVCRCLLEKLLQSRNVADRKDQLQANREANELIAEGDRLMTEQEAHGVKHDCS